MPHSSPGPRPVKSAGPDSRARLRLEVGRRHSVTTPLRERALSGALTGRLVGITEMSDHDLEQLRRALAHALGRVEVGSPASALLAQLSRRARSEQRRRARRAEHPRPAA